MGKFTSFAYTDGKIYKFCRYWWENLQKLQILVRKLTFFVDTDEKIYKNCGCGLNGGKHFYPLLKSLCMCLIFNVL